MSIIRGARPESNWYALDKQISEDARLSWAARGLLIYLLGKPDHWKVSIEHLRAQTAGARVRTGRDGVYALLTELQTAGYVSTSRSRADDGTLGPVDYIVSERPAPTRDASPRPAQPEVDKTPGFTPLPAQPDTAEPDTAEPTLVKTERAAKTEGSKKATPSPAATALPEWVDPEAWAGFAEMRKRIRAPLTKRAIELTLRELDKLRATNDPNEVLDQSTQNGWRGVFAIKTERGANHAGHRESAAERVRRLAIEGERRDRAAAGIHGG